MPNIRRSNRYLSAFLAILFLVCAVMLPNGSAIAEAETDGLAEWTVMLYLCGSDLESNYSKATNNLQAIAKTTPVPEVNFVIETGGAREWHAQELGMDVDPTKLERWTYTAEGFRKVGEAELASMGEQRTLQDFLTWTMENYPAKKYQLILWDHGGASMCGVVFDQLHNNSSLQLFDLAGALEASGIHLEVFMTDTCLMAMLETVEAISPYANYFVGCEEVLPGDGTNYTSYIQFLYDYPECSGEALGKRVCSSTEAMYSDRDSLYTLGFLTLSLIDLSRTAAVREAFDDFISEVSQLLDDPARFYQYCYATRNRESYYYRQSVDLYDLAQHASGHGVSAKTAARLQNAIEEAVLYNATGNNHIRSHGMSIWYNLNESQFNLDHYSRVFHDPVYLAFLDRLSYTWRAPEWVYETVEHKPDISYRDYSAITSTGISEDGKAAFLEMPASDYFIILGEWELLQHDPNTDLWRKFGRDPFLTEETEGSTLRWKITFDGTWPSLGGVPLTMNITDEQETYIAFTTPMMIGDYSDSIRIQYRLDTEEGEAPRYILMGSSPYDDHTGFPDRNVKPIPPETSVEPLATLLNLQTDAGLDYRAAEPFVYDSDMQITKEALPVGQYAVRFVTTDIFGKETYSEMIYCDWDGQSVTYHKM